MAILNYDYGPVKARGQLLDVTNQVNLTVQYKDPFGNPTNTDTFPTISITQPSGLVAIAPTSAGVANPSTGLYSFIFTIPINGPYGVWVDEWVGYMNGFRLDSSFQFVVSHTDLPAINTDGYVHLGDDPGFNYSQFAIKNINKLIKSLRNRLNSSGKAKSSDSYGNVIYVDCDIFSVDMLTTFVATALWDFNQVPYFTFFDFEDSDFVEQFGEVLVEGATLYALASKALIERGREFQITDNGLNFNPPTVSELMQTQYSTLLSHYWEKLKYIKNSLRPHPRGLGVFSMNSGINPAFSRLRHLRARRLI
ncbi:unnamed protein product [Sphagnum balticum]